MSEDWYGSMPEELQSAPFFKPLEDGSHRTIDQVVSDLTNAAAHMGNSLRMPGPDASDEDRMNFAMRAAEKNPMLMVRPNTEDAEAMESLLKTLGKPDEPSEYALPEEVEIAEDALVSLRQKAHQYGMTKKQFESWVKDMHNESQESMQRQQDALEQDINGLKADWGDAMQSRLERIAGTLAKTGAPEYLTEALKNNKLPSTDIKWLYSLAESLGGEGQPLSQDTNHQDVMTPDEARRQAREITRNPILKDPSHPEYRRLVQKRFLLMEKAQAAG